MRILIRFHGNPLCYSSHHCVERPPSIASKFGNAAAFFTSSLEVF